MSTIAQDELRKLSERVKFGHRQAIENGVVLGNGRIFGYDKFKKRLVINEDEAPMVAEIFELYASGDYSLNRLKVFSGIRDIATGTVTRLPTTLFQASFQTLNIKGIM